jgi:hypothetical protein
MAIKHRKLPSNTRILVTKSAFWKVRNYFGLFVFVVEKKPPVGETGAVWSSLTHSLSKCFLLLSSEPDIEMSSREYLIFYNNNDTKDDMALR